MADPPRSPDAQPNDFDGDEEHEDATMVASLDQLEVARAEAMAGGSGNVDRVNAPKERERTTLPPEQKVFVAAELTGQRAAVSSTPSKGPMFAAIAVCVLGFGVLLFALLRR